MIGKNSDHLRKRVGHPEAAKDVDVRLNDAVYNFSRAKYSGTDAHLGALCVVNGWLDKAVIRVTKSADGNYHRTFKLPCIHKGQKIKLPEKSQLKELDKQAFAYWDKKYPIKPTAENPQEIKQEIKKDRKTDSQQAKRDHAVDVAKNVTLKLQADLMQSKTELDKGIGSVFGHGVDALESKFGKHGSRVIAKNLDEKQTQIKQMGKSANDGNLDEFGKLHKVVTGSEFDPGKLQTARLSLDQELKAFNKHHIAGVENLTEIATFGASWAVMAGLGKAKGIAGLAKQALLMTGFGAAAKAGFKGIEHGNMDTAADDVRTGAISGLGVFAADKVLHGVAAKFHGEKLNRVVFRGAMSGGSAGATYGFFESPNMAFTHARNERRNYDAGNFVQDAAVGVCGGFMSGAALGALGGAVGHGYRAWRARQTPTNLDSIGRSGAGSKHTEAPLAKVEAVVPAPTWDAARVPQWENYRLPENPTWANVVDSCKALAKFCHPETCVNRAGLNVKSPEYPAFVRSPEYQAHVNLYGQVMRKYKDIQELGLPIKLADRQATAAPKRIVDLWNEMEANIDFVKVIQAAGNPIK